MEILGVKIDNIDWTGADKKVRGFLVDNFQHLVATVNPEMIVDAQTDEEFKKILNSADLSLPDGTGLVFASIFLGQGLWLRIPGVDFVWKLAEIAAQTDHSVYLLGGKDNVAAQTAAVLQKRFPELKIYFGGDGATPTDPALLAEINNIGPSILLVAFGHGRQEKWIRQNLSSLPSVNIALGVGGTFDFISGKVKRAPNFFRRLGLEWLWRLIVEPWRLKRIFKATCKFSYLVIKSRISKS